MTSNIGTGAVSAAVVAFLSAVMDAATAFHAFAFTTSEETAVLAVATSGIVLGGLLFAVFTHQTSIIKMQLRAGAGILPPK